MSLTIPQRRIVVMALSGVGYFVFAWLGYAFTARLSGVAVVWPPSGLLLALLVLLHKSEWPFVLIGAILGNITADVVHGASFAVALEGSGANAFESLVAAWLLVRFLGSRIGLNSLREVLGLVVGAVILSNAVTALFGSLVLSHGQLNHFSRGWFVWWAGDGMGMLIVAPVILTWSHVVRSRERIRPQVALEALIVFAALAALAQVLHSRAPGTAAGFGGQPYMAFPLLIWAAVRFGPWGAATATLILCGVTTWNTAHGVGPFARGAVDPMTQVLEMYSYLALAAVSSLVPAAILSERKLAERTLQTSERRFRQMADYIKEAFFVVELATGELLYASPTWSEIWGRPIEDAYDPHIWLETVHPDDRATVIDSQAAIMRGEPTTTVFRISRPDGSSRWVRRRAFPVRNESGAVYRLVGVSEDITEVRQVEERFLQAQKMEAVGNLAGGVAHDFNNLITVILSYSEILLSDLAANDPLRADAEAIRKAGERASELTRKLLTFSRKQVIQPKIVRINELIEATGYMLKRLISENISLAMALDPQAGAVRADAGQMEQVIVNLAVNARDAMPNGGQLLIESRNVEFPEPVGTNPGTALYPSGHNVMLAISDTGVGMDAETQQRIFEPFYTTKEPDKGTGLGLATVYGIVRQSGGHISVYSEPGKGTSFKVYLPRVDDVRERPEEIAEDVESAVGKRETILIVDDDPAVLRVACSALDRLGYFVISMSDGESALAYLMKQNLPIDLLVTDVIMPRMNGRILADRFAAIRPHAGILFVSGYTDDAVVRHGILESSVHYLGKPFTPQSLAKKVREVLNDVKERRAEEAFRRVSEVEDA